MYRLPTFYPLMPHITEGQLRLRIAETLLTTDPCDSAYAAAERLLALLDKK